MTESLFFLFLCALFGSIVFYTLLLGISPMPSSKKAKRAMMGLLPGEIDGGVIYELGSGWGGLAQLIAKSYPLATVIAFEESPVPYLFSRTMQYLLGRPNLRIVRKNFYNHTLSDARAIVCYLYPGAMKKLGPKFKAELPKGCIIVSNSFSLADWDNCSCIFLDDWAATRIYKFDVF